MERKIGEVFDYQGKKLKVMEGRDCNNCYFKDGFTCDIKNTGECLSDQRKDGKPVTFVDVTEQEQSQLNLCEVLKYCPKGEQFWSPLLGDVNLFYIDEEAKNIKVLTKGGFTWNINRDGTITINGEKSTEIMLYPSRKQRDWAKVKYEPKKAKFDPKALKPFDKVLSKYDGGCWSANLFSHIEEEDNKYHVTCSFVCNGSLVKFCIPYNDDTKHLVGTKGEAPEFYKYWED